MHPPLSMVFFTTLTGAAQGLLIALFGIDVAATLGLLAVPRSLFLGGAAIVLALSGVGLVAASFHLGHPLRAWRAASMWRTSWLSREVIALPVFMAAVAAWGAAHFLQMPTLWPGAVAAVMAGVLYVCTGMIYGAVKAIPQWATPMTPINYTVIGLASGWLLAAALTAVLAPALAPTLAGLALAATVLGAATRGATLWRNLHSVSRTTLQTAIGVRHPRIVQKAQGSMGGSFNTREFFHGRTPGFARGMRWVAGGLGFVLPAAVLSAMVGGSSAPAALLAGLFAVQFLGLLAERWSFFAEGQHTQNLYYRSMS